MADDSQIVLNRFHEYADAFGHLKPSKVLPFLHYPAISIAPNKISAIKNRIEGFITFKIIMSSLKRRKYHHTRTKFLSVWQIRHDLAVITGAIIRYKNKDENKHTELER